MARNRDVEVLSRSFRSRVWLWLALVAAALGAALWSSTRDRGQGAPEERGRLVIATAGPEGIDAQVALFERAGFVVEVDSYDGWLTRARGEVDSEAEGLALLLELADLRGAGYLVVEDPARLDLGGLEIEAVEPEYEDLEERDFAAFSVGDLAFPHRLSADDQGAPRYVRLPGYGALQAVFRQPSLFAREREERPTVDELRHEAAIRLGRDMAERPEAFDGQVAALDELLHARLEGPGIRMALEGIVAGEAIPTPDGGLLLIHRELDVYSADARTLELELAGPTGFDWVPPGELDDPAGARRPCTALAAAELEPADSPTIHAAPDGSALAIAAGEGRPTSLWHKQPVAGCEWRAVADVPPISAQTTVELVAPRRARGNAELLARGGPLLLARADIVVTDELSQARVRLWSQAEGGELREHELLRLPTTAVRQLDLVDDARVLALTREALLLVDRHDPAQFIELSHELLARGHELGELEVVPAGEGLHVLLTAAGPRGVELLELRLTPEQLAALASDEPQVASAEQLGLRRLLTQAKLYSLAASPDGHRVALVLREGTGRGELALLDLPGGDEPVGELLRLTDDHTPDDAPRFSADGRYLSATSLVKLWISPKTYLAPRLLDLDLLAPR